MHHPKREDGEAGDRRCDPTPFVAVAGAGPSCRTAATVSVIVRLLEGVERVWASRRISRSSCPKAQRPHIWHQIPAQPQQRKRAALQRRVQRSGGRSSEEEWSEESAEVAARIEESEQTAGGYGRGRRHPRCRGG